MSTPRPTEADVEALATSISGCISNVSDLPKWMQVPALGNDMRPILQLVVRAVLASDWLAVRGAEHRREVRRRSDLAFLVGVRFGAADLRAEAAERDRDEARRELADLRAKVATLADEFESRGDRTLPAGVAPVLAGMIRALLTTEDDQ